MTRVYLSSLLSPIWGVINFPEDEGRRARTAQGKSDTELTASISLYFYIPYLLTAFHLPRLTECIVAFGRNTARSTNRVIEIGDS